MSSHGPCRKYTWNERAFAPGDAGLVFADTEQSTLFDTELGGVRPVLTRAHGS
jgi:hypothetical protein